MATLHTDADKRIYEMYMDSGRRYWVSNSGLYANHADAYLRVLATYLPQDSLNATIYSTSTVYVLHDSTEVAQRDPVNVLSVWRGGGFINMHLQPKTQGLSSHQRWGFCIDSVAAHHHYLSLYHDQNDDKESYSTDVYASIQLSRVDSLFVQGDTLSFTIHTYRGTKTWTFQY